MISGKGGRNCKFTNISSVRKHTLETAGIMDFLPRFQIKTSLKTMTKSVLSHLMLQKNTKNPMVPMVMVYSTITVMTVRKMLEESQNNKHGHVEDMRFMLMIRTI